MKLAIVSDIHGNLPALDAVLAEIEKEGDVDAIVNAGDTLSGPLLPVETAERLMARPDIAMIAGNHERQVLTLPIDRMNKSDSWTAGLISDAHRRWLATAPPTRWIGDEIFVCHGTPSSDLHYLMETVNRDFVEGTSPGVRAATSDELRERLGGGQHLQARVIVCGHSHSPRVNVSKSPDHDHPILVVNPGSVGLPGYDDNHPHQHVIETGSPHARYAVVQKGKSGWSVQLRCVAYDFESMARLAESRGRTDWSLPLRTGRML